jgi:hypothetical protein
VGAGVAVGADVGVDEDVGVDVNMLSKGDVGAEVLLLLEGEEEGADDGTELLLDGADVVAVSMIGGLVESPRGVPMLIAEIAPMLIPG